MRNCVRIRSESTSALGQPRLTKPTRGEWPGIPHFTEMQPPERDCDEQSTRERAVRPRLLPALLLQSAHCSNQSRRDECPRQPHRGLRGTSWPAGAQGPGCGLRRGPAAGAAEARPARAPAIRGSRSANTCAGATAGSTAASRISRAREQFDLVICYDVLQYLKAVADPARAGATWRACVAACCISAC